MACIGVPERFGGELDDDVELAPKLNVDWSEGLHPQANTPSPNRQICDVVLENQE